MSLPKFPDINPDCNIDNAICQILTSIAMEEIGLSHIINAEGEKLQYILGTLHGTKPPNPTIGEILKVNESVKDTLQQVAFNQMLLNAKMSGALKAYLQNEKDNGDTPGPFRIRVKFTGENTRNLAVGDKFIPEYIIEPKEYENRAVWHSSDPSVASVDNNGMITAHRKGTAVITLTVEGVSDSITVIVADEAEPPVPDIAGAPDGSIIILDDTEWVKIKDLHSAGKNYSLLMLNDVLGPWAYGSAQSSKLQYKNSDIKNKIDGWYAYLDAPTLKSIAAQAEVGSDANSSWPMEQTGIYAHLPKKSDVDTLPASVRSVNKDYWLANPAEIEGFGWTAQDIIKANGSYGIKQNDASPVYARPMVWVLTP